MFKKILYTLHRVLGTILSILFLIWFLSGFVMIYHTFPKVKQVDRYRTMSTLYTDTAIAKNIFTELPEDISLKKLTLRIKGNVPVFEFATTDSLFQKSIDSTFTQNPVITYSQIEEYAKRWDNSQIAYVDTLYELEQWIPFGYLKKDFPIYKFYFSDKDEHQLYVSSRTGEALQYTDKNSRFWSWLGPIPHWVYFTSLRQNSSAWVDVLVWLSGIGAIMCLAGLILGVYVLYKQYKNKKNLTSPYRKNIYKWHHILGFIFGIFVFTFVFSGMMSLADIPQWVVKTQNKDIEDNLYTPQNINLQDYKLSYITILEKYPNQVKSIEWSTFGTLPFYKVIIDDKLKFVDASTDTIKYLALSSDNVLNRLKTIQQESMHISLMNEYDNYYVGLTDHLPLPIYKVVVDDVDKSVYYVNPKNGSIKYYNKNTRLHKWTYQGLHSFKFKFLAERPVLWNIVMWTTMIGGTLVSFTGVWLGFRYIKRKLKKLKRYICNKK